MENHGQKRSADEQTDVLKGIQTILLDIEGTTTPIAFVKDKLFPYVRTNVKDYLSGHYEEEECQDVIIALRDQAAADKDMDGVVEIPADDDNQEAVIEATVNNILWQMDTDRKTTSLKQLQGHMYREAYKTGLIQGEVFDDVVPALRQWLDQGKDICTYSSGSVDAQKLLFGYSEKGNLLELFSGCYDTTIGSKTEKESYSKIAGKMSLEPKQVAFFTDLSTEACAAGEAGMKVVVVVRDGNAPLSDEDKKKYYTISSFDELCEAEAKRVVEVEGDDADDVDDNDDDIDDLDGDDDAENVDDDDDVDAEGDAEEETA